MAIVPVTPDQVRYLPGGLRSKAIAPWTAKVGFIEVLQVAVANGRSALVAALPPAHAEKKAKVVRSHDGGRPDSIPNGR